MYVYLSGSLHQRVQRVPSHILILVQHVPTRILVLVQHVPARISALAPATYVTVSDHTRTIQRYHMYGNPVRIFYLAWNHPYFTQQCESTVYGKGRIRIRVCMSLTLLRPHKEISPLD